MNNKMIISGLVLVCWLGIVSLGFSGCSVLMAAKQPGKKNLSVLDPGTPRTDVIAELGAPQWTEEKDGRNVDIFSFVQGYSTPAKAGRAFFHGAADVFSLGLWEVIGTPVEAIADGTEIKVEVMYDENEKVQQVRYLNQPKEGKTSQEVKEVKDEATEAQQE